MKATLPLERRHFARAKGDTFAHEGDTAPAQGDAFATECDAFRVFTRHPRHIRQLHPLHVLPGLTRDKASFAHASGALPHIECGATILNRVLFPC